MGIWIVSDNLELGGSVKAQIDALNLRASSARVLPPQGAIREASSGASAPYLVIIASVRADETLLQVVREMRAACSARLIVAAIAADHASVIKSVRAGADDFVTIDEQFSEELSASFRRLSSNAGEKKPGGSLIAVTPSRDISDGAFLAVNLATAIAEAHGSCGLLDFNLRGGDAALMLKLAPKHNLLDLVRRRQTVDQSMFEQVVAKHESGVELLAGPDLFADTHEIDPSLCRQVIAHSQASHPFCVISVEDLQHAEQIGFLADCDSLFITTRLDLVSLYRTQLHLDFLRKQSDVIGRTKIVALGAGHAGEIPARSACRILQMPEIGLIPDDAATVVVSLNIGNPAVRECPQSKVSRAIVKLATELAPASATSAPAPRRNFLPFGTASLFGLQASATLGK